jgi:phage shock protein A
MSNVQIAIKAEERNKTQRQKTKNLISELNRQKAGLEEQIERLKKRCEEQEETIKELKDRLGETDDLDA